MLIDQFPETTFEVVDKFTSLTDFKLTAQHSIGQECSAGQEGHESHDSDKRILRCTEVSAGVYRWQDTGRVMS